MNGKPFFDTNVLIYAAVPTDPRAAVARALLEAGGSIGVQQLNEFVAVARRRLKQTWDEIARKLSDFQILCLAPVPITAELHRTGMQIAQRYCYQIYDALCIAAALESGSNILYSEELHDSQVIGGLTIRNPFREGSKRWPSS